MSGDEIVVVPFPHPGHLFPAIELCLRLAERNCRITLIQPTSSASSASFLHPLINTVHLPIPDSIRIDPSFVDTTFPKFLTDFLDERRRSSSLPICAIIDEMVGSLITPFVDFGVPAVSFFTSSAISSALEHALSQIEPLDVGSTAVFEVPGLPKEVAMSASDFAHHQNGGPPPLGPHRSRDGRPRRRRDVASTDGAVGLIMNTCVDLESPFLKYVARVAAKPVWAVGPLLPDLFWSALSGPARDAAGARRGGEYGVSEAAVLDWLDSKPQGSVIYVSFGSLVGPNDAELEELAAGLEESGRSFIWVIKPGARQHEPDGRPIVTNGSGYSSDGLEKRVQGRGMVIRGWAPQLAILSHSSTGGYVCHCGWNSTLEALGCGVPVLAWPIRGDQTYNAKLLVSQLRVGVSVRPAPGKAVTKTEVVLGIEKLMTDEEMRKRATSIRSIFAQELPLISSAALNDFLEFLSSDSEKQYKSI
ncbi:UDP-glycosyltransferase 73C4 [Dendrobium catenatum]|uniref:Glycosyltransferase n=1 Tax=Dendrobium catenatum TaxID=906689 RepID=A0A2I0VRI8_9ASPA|nr:UDP-glycosyltransferase 73C4 [Dendrobium catenatum]PKU66013.1 Anthocyanin 3'-O-beta-glucosyltransferase [Dendrobium catenatum]